MDISVSSWRASCLVFVDFVLAFICCGLMVLPMAIVQSSESSLRLDMTGTISLPNKRDRSVS